MEEIGLNEDIAQACWDVLNIDTEGDSLGVIDEDELDKLLEMFGSDANGEELDEIDKITLGSLYTKLDSADKVDETDEVDESDNNNSAIKTESNTSTETDSPDLLGSLVQGFKDGFNFLFNLTPINFLSSLFGGNSSTQSNQTNQNSLGNVITSAVSEEVAEVAEPLKKTLVDGLLDGAKTLISGLFSKK